MLFTKMHGIGNDYVYVNCFEEQVDDPSALSKAISDRHFGVGSDGLILICPSEKADVRMRMFNSDGSESEMCGNGIRCVAKYTYDHRLVGAGEPFTVPGGQTYRASLNIETGNGILKVGLITNPNGKVESVCVNMGQPILESKLIPVAIDSENVIKVPFEVEGKTYEMTCVSMGNPHAVFFVRDARQIPLNVIGPIIENHGLFPQRINVHFVQVKSSAEFTMRTWERGSGITLACGTGACACAVAGVLTGRCARITLAHLPGGDLELNWSETDNCVYMTGSATEVYSGTWPE
jgi:diaminopimelate epimerase